MNMMIRAYINKLMLVFKKYPIRVIALFLLIVMICSFFLWGTVLSFNKYDGRIGVNLLDIIGAILQFTYILITPIVFTIFEGFITYNLYKNNVYVLQGNNDQILLLGFEILALIILMIGEWVVVLLHYPAGGFLNFNNPPDTYIFIICMLLYLIALCKFSCFGYKHKKIFYIFMLIGIVDSILTILVPAIKNAFLGIEINRVDSIGDLIFTIIMYFPFLPINLILIFLRVVKMEQTLI